MKEATYTIQSAPKSIRYTCPYCGKDVEKDVKDTDIDIWEGGIDECPECHKDVDLHGWEYD